jgi:hypothetical protein
MKHIKGFKIFEKISDTDIIKKLKNSISEFGKGEFEVKIIDKRPGKKNKIVKAKSNGDIVSIQSANESLKDNIKVGLVCTILASGLVSCKKADVGFGYNLNTKPITHNIGKGTPNKKVNIMTPGADKVVDIDTTFSKEKSGWSGHGVYLKNEPTKTEIIVLRYGAMINAEKRFNNGRGYDDNKIVYDIPFNTNTELSGDGKLYQTSGDEPMDVRDYPDFKDGLKSIQNDPNRFEMETGLKANDILGRL